MRNIWRTLEASIVGAFAEDSLSGLDRVQYEGLAFVLAKVTQSLASEAMEYRGQGNQRKGKDGGRDESLDPGVVNGIKTREPASSTNKAGAATELKGRMAELLETEGRLLPGVSLVAPRWRTTASESSRRSPDGTISQDERNDPTVASIRKELRRHPVFSPTACDAIIGSVPIEVVARPVGGLLALLQGGERAAVSLIMAGAPGTFDFATTLEWDEGEPELLIVFCPRSDGTQGNIDQLAQQVAPDSQQGGDPWHIGMPDRIRRSLGRGTSLMHLVTSGKDGDRRLALQCLAPMMSIHVVEGSLVPAALQVFRAAAGSQVGVALVSAHVALALAALAQTCGGELRYRQVTTLQRTKQPRPPARHRMQSASQGGSLAEGTQEEARVIKLPIHKWMFRSKWFNGTTLVTGPVVVAVSGITASTPIPPVVLARDGSHRITTWIMDSVSRRWTGMESHIPSRSQVIPELKPIKAMSFAVGSGESGNKSLS